MSKQELKSLLDEKVKTHEFCMQHLPAVKDNFDKETYEFVRRGIFKMEDEILEMITSYVLRFDENPLD